MSPYLLKLSAGLALLAAGLTASGYALYHLIHAGVCLSDLSFVEDTSCFDNAGTWAKALPAGLAVAGLGLVVFAARGAAPDAPGARRFRTHVVGWAAALAAGGFTLIWAVAGPDADVSDSARTSGLILGGVLFPAALIPLWREYRSVLESRATGGGMAPTISRPDPTEPPAWTPTPQPPSPPPPPPPAPTTSAPLATGSPGTGIERLNELARQRDSGAITPEEFERQKAEVLSDMTRGL